jgi:type III restriction enzyme
MKHAAPLLNVSYVLTASAKFNETLQNIVRGLQASGFSEKDYRQKDMMPEDEKKQSTTKPLESFLFPELEETQSIAYEIEPERISFNSDPETIYASNNEVVTDIENMAETQNREMEAVIEKQSQQAVDENIFQEMGDKVKRYRIVDSNRDVALAIKLPQFFLEVSHSDIFSTRKVHLNQESLLNNFKLSNEDSKIDFDQIESDLYKVDIEQLRKDEYAPRFTKIEDLQFKDPIIDFILAKPKDKQVKDIAHQIVQVIGEIYPISDYEIRAYVERIIGQLNAEQLQDILVRKWSYSDRIKTKIRLHADSFAEGRFNDLVTIGKVVTEPAWSFPEMIVPGPLGASIGNSLYEREGLMNNFETSVITSIASLSNIAFWHRNLGRGKGFSINGFKSNHYPDFIVVSKSGKIIIVETKGDDRDNSDSAAKCRLGNKWAELAGKEFLYFMVFDKKAIDGAYNVEKAKELIRQL